MTQIAAGEHSSMTNCVIFFGGGGEITPALRNLIMIYENISFEAGTPHKDQQSHFQSDLRAMQIASGLDTTAASSFRKISNRPRPNGWTRNTFYPETYI